MRPTYAMLLRHAWLADLMKPPTISEADEEDEGQMDQHESAGSVTGDPEVAEWVKGALEKRKSGTMGKKEKPALHAAPLDAVSSPSLEASTADPPKILGSE